jgi:hypothetical protein
MYERERERERDLIYVPVPITYIIFICSNVQMLMYFFCSIFILS